MFRASILCGKNPKVVKADPEDLVIVCGEVSVETENQFNSDENEVNLSLLSFHKYITFYNKCICIDI